MASFLYFLDNPAPVNRSFHYGHFSHLQFLFPALLFIKSRDDTLLQEKHAGRPFAGFAQQKGAA